MVFMKIWIPILIFSALAIVMIADIPEHDPVLPPGSDGRFLFTKKCPFTYCSKVCPTGFERNIWGCLFCKCTVHQVHIPPPGSAPASDPGPAPGPGPAGPVQPDPAQPGPGGAKIILDEHDIGGPR